MSNLALLSLNLMISFAISFFSGFPLTKYAHVFRLIHTPFENDHDLNPTKTPLVGGLILLMGLLPNLIFFSLFPVYEEGNSFVYRLIIPMLIVFVFGIWDDLKALSVLGKFIGQVLASIAFIFLGNPINIFHIPWIDFLLTIVWLVGITNAFNLLDSREGIVNGISIITSIMLLIFISLSGLWSMSLVVSSILGACIALIYFNTKPGKTFLGDSGAQLLGFMFAAIVLFITQLRTRNYSEWIFLLLLFLVPIFDTTFVVITRLIKRKNPFNGDFNHTFHRLSRILNDENDAIHLLVYSSLTIDLFAYLFLELNLIFFYLIFVILIVFVPIGFIIYKLDRGNSI